MQTVGIGTRVLNFVVDMLIISLISMFCFHGWNVYAQLHYLHVYNYGWFFWGTILVYYLFFEMLFARTPGKWLSYTKVVTSKGKRPSAGIIILRTLSRLIVIDMFFIPFLDKTLHDYLSKTEVVQVS